jgi:hypothetical protein
MDADFTFVLPKDDPKRVSVRAGFSSTTALPSRDVVGSTTPSLKAVPLLMLPWSFLLKKGPCQNNHEAKGEVVLTLPLLPSGHGGQRGAEPPT